MGIVERLSEGLFRSYASEACSAGSKRFTAELSKGYSCHNFSCVATLVPIHSYIIKAYQRFNGLILMPGSIGVNLFRRRP